jgi:2-oxoglutarate ferredoxin oxidoreductase subunit alpha
MCCSPFYQHSYDDHLNSLKKGGIVLYDSDHVEPKPDEAQNYHHIGVPISSRTVEAIGGVGAKRARTSSRSACWPRCST